MEIRGANEADIPQIVELLKQSLGEGLMAKSEAYWRWKHVENPFGQSPVIIALENENIIGVRAFMRWTWTWKGKAIRAVRAVDTATHPQYQGKGIFSTLTKALVEQCREEGIDFIFNTPNEKSRPGYLKMGWQTAGRLPVTIQLRSPLKMAMRYLSNKPGQEETKESDQLEYCLTHPSMPALLHKQKQKNATGIVTDVTLPYLEWRYRQVPAAKYFAAGEEQDGRLTAVVFYRLKASRPGVEMRIADAYAESESASESLRKLVRDKARAHHADYITAEGLSGRNLFGGIRLTRSIGPVVTVRRVNAENLDDYLNFKNWRPGMGDLELF